MASLRRKLKVLLAISIAGPAVLCGGIVVGLSGGLTGCHSVPKLTSQEVEGKHLYSVRCAHCHDFNDLALKKAPPDLHGVFKGIVLPSGAPATDVEMRRVILAGKRMMPGFSGRFTDEEMRALVAYLHTGLR